MNLPKNGTIVIIDDKISEAYPLMNALSKRGVAYSYYDGKPKNYPATTLSNVRLVFLDMHLDEVASASNGGKNVVSTLVAGLNALVGVDNGPYAILVWSKHDAQHMIELKKTIMEKNGLECKPIALLNLEKASCFEMMDVDAGQEKQWKLKPNGLNIIEENMEKQLKKVDAFSVLYNWEDGIRESAKQTVKEISSLFYIDNGEWNKNIKSFMVKMARAYAGKTIDSNNNDILKNVFYSFNNIINGYTNTIVDTYINGINGIIMESKEENINGAIELTCAIKNSIYILSFEENIFYLYKDGEQVYQNKKIEKIFEYDREQVGTFLYELYMNNIARVNSLLMLRSCLLNEIHPGNIYNAHDNIKNEMCNEFKLSLSERCRVDGIEMEISPICDYSQQKRKRLRILPGLLIPLDIKINEKSKYIYITKPIMVDEKVVRAVFDFRYFTSERLEYFRGKKAEFAAGDALLQNIKEELYSHGIRSGMVVLN